MVRALVFLLCSLLAVSANADERPTSERIGDGFGFGLTTAGLTVAGAFVGGLSSVALSDGNSSGGWLSPLVNGVAIGGLAGFVGGGLLFDGQSDGDGSLAAAAGGALVGLGIAALVEDEKTFWRSGLLLAVVGAAAGYALVDAPGRESRRPVVHQMSLGLRF